MRIGIALLAAALAFCPAAIAGGMNARALAEAVAEAEGAKALADPGLEKIEIADVRGGDTISAPMGREYLASAGIEVIDDIVDGKPVLRVMPMRSVATRVGSLQPLVLGEKDAIPGNNRYVQKMFHVKHGDADAILTAIRAEMTRDPRRAGMIMRARDTITITDLAPNLRRFEKTIAEMDRPAAAAEDAPLDNVRIDVEIWTVARAVLDEMRERPKDLQEMLRGAPDTRRLHWFTGAAAKGGGPGIRIMSVEEGSAATKADDMSLDVEASALRDAKKLGVRVKLSFSQGSTRLTIPERDLYLRAGVWSLLHADAGLAVLIRAREE